MMVPNTVTGSGSVHCQVRTLTCMRLSSYSPLCIKMWIGASMCLCVRSYPLPAADILGMSLCSVAVASLTLKFSTLSRYVVLTISLAFRVSTSCFFLRCRSSDAVR